MEKQTKAHVWRQMHMTMPKAAWPCFPLFWWSIFGFHIKKYKNVTIFKMTKKQKKTIGKKRQRKRSGHSCWQTFIVSKGYNAKSTDVPAHAPGSKDNDDTCDDIISCKVNTANVTSAPTLHTQHQYIDPPDTVHMVSPLMHPGGPKKIDSQSYLMSWGAPFQKSSDMLLNQSYLFFISVKANQNALFVIKSTQGVALTATCNQTSCFENFQHWTAQLSVPHAKIEDIF